MFPALKRCDCEFLMNRGRHANVNRIYAGIVKQSYRIGDGRSAAKFGSRFCSLPVSTEHCHDFSANDSLVTLSMYRPHPPATEDADSDFLMFRCL